MFSEYLKNLVVRRLRKRGIELVHRTELGPNDGYLDKREFHYIVWLYELYGKIQEVPGDIFEMGVARGRNAILFNTFMRILGDDAYRRYVGFDTFDGYVEKDLADNPGFKSDKWKSTSVEFVTERMRALGFGKTSRFVVGDIVETLPAFLEKNPSTKVALLYIDCNAHRPSRAAMDALRPRMTPGGVIAVDELRPGGETNALAEFCAENGFKMVRDKSPFTVPVYTRVG